MSLNNQFPTELEEGTEGWITIANTVWPRIQDDLPERFTDRILEGFFLNQCRTIWRDKQALDVVHKLKRLHFLTRGCFTQISTAQSIRNIHEGAFLVPNFEIVTLKSEEHLLHSCRGITEALVKDRFQVFVICFHVDYIAPKNIFIKFLAREHNGEELFLNLSVPGRGLSEGSRCKAHWML